MTNAPAIRPGRSSCGAENLADARRAGRDAAVAGSRETGDRHDGDDDAEHEQHDADDDRGSRGAVLVAGSLRLAAGDESEDESDDVEEDRQDERDDSQGLARV